MTRGGVGSMLAVGGVRVIDNGCGLIIRRRIYS